VVTKPIDRQKMLRHLHKDYDAKVDMHGSYLRAFVEGNPGALISVKEDWQDENVAAFLVHMLEDEDKSVTWLQKCITALNWNLKTLHPDHAKSIEEVCDLLLRTCSCMHVSFSFFARSF
jgi:hypothetical protein